LLLQDLILFTVVLTVWF